MTPPTATAGVTLPVLPTSSPLKDPASGERAHPKARSLQLSAIPKQGTTITHLDLDLTVACNLACSYCFKNKWKQHMEVKTAFDAVVWLIHASGEAQEISLVFIGGEPLLKFETIRKLVPFAVRRAAQHGKRLKMSITTNGTIVSEEILEFFRRWRIGFHTSIDGHPAVQDAHRVYRDGRGSSPKLQENLPKILKIWPGATARSTICPDTAGEIYKSYEYFIGLGYVDIAFVPGDIDQWDDDTIARYRSEFEKVALDVIQSFRDDRPIKVKYIHEMCESRAQGRKERPPAPCGAGRGMALVDVEGELWPCHRWNSAAARVKQDGWKHGSLYEPRFDENTRKPFHAALPHHVDGVSCNTCVARTICAGGCPAENLEMMGDITLHHPNACKLVELMAEVGARVYDTLTEEACPRFLSAYTQGGNTPRSKGGSA